jgi:NADPH-dependent ferric siderophore reductase
MLVWLHGAGRKRRDFCGLRIESPRLEIFMTATAPTKSRKPRYPATVKRVEHLTPRMVRVTFTSPELADFGWNGPAAHIKLIFGGPSPSAPPPTETPRPTMRTYTPRRFDRESGELDVDFILHGEGPASTWASQAAVGQTLTIAGPGRNYVIDPTAEWFLLIGDETAIPAISTILETLPSSASATVFLEVADREDEVQLPSHENAKVTWLHRGPDPRHAGGPLEASMRSYRMPAGSGRIYVACEAGAMRRIRAHLLMDKTINREHVITRGYWKLGETDHPDGDYGQDVSSS